MKTRLDQCYEGYQPRYVAYCVSLGMTPSEQQESDGHMGHYMAWIRERLTEFREMQAIAPLRPLTDSDHAKFTDWLLDWAESQHLPHTYTCATCGWQGKNPERYPDGTPYCRTRGCGDARVRREGAA